MQVGFDLIIMLNNKEKLKLSVRDSLALLFRFSANGLPILAGASADYSRNYTSREMNFGECTYVY
ncbi:MAG: hypothetical protein KUG56_04410 [Kordiimonadaceae bacterium]|nr:hypothetical protein [Kordiimonadaceae bacterium]